jgi:acetolactate synthase-1/2/3 large subunit
MRENWRLEESADGMTPTFIAKCVREVITEDSIVLNEAITGKPAVDRHIPRTKPGTFFLQRRGARWGGAAERPSA